jgi:hypothetical protein
MLRVVLGRARPDTEWSRKISALRFNSTSGGMTSTMLTVSRSHDVVELDLEANREPTD